MISFHYQRYPIKSKIFLTDYLLLLRCVRFFGFFNFFFNFDMTYFNRLCLVVGVLTLGYSNIVKLLVEILVLKHARYTKIVTSKCETVI